MCDALRMVATSLTTPLSPPPNSRLPRSISAATHCHTLADSSAERPTVSIAELTWLRVELGVGGLGVGVWGRGTSRVKGKVRGAPARLLKLLGVVDAIDLGAPTHREVTDLVRGRGRGRGRGPR